MTYRIVFAPEARDDLRELYLFIAKHAGNTRAMGYIDRVENYCHGFETYPKRGIQRNDLLPGLRVTIAFHISGDTVIFDRILYGGRDLEGLMAT